MVTGRQLMDFAEEHKLLIPPYLDLDERAKELNANGGKCCAERTCPCEECLEEIQDADDEDAACTCRLFCDQRYATFWNRAWKKYQRQKEKKQQKEQQTQETVMEENEAEEEQEREPEETEQSETEIDWNREIKNEKIVGVVGALRDARDLIEKGTPESYMEAAQILEEEAPLHTDCSLCGGVLDVESMRMRTLGMECDGIDNKACSEDVDRAYDRLTELIERFIRLDTDLEENPIIPELENIGKDERKKVEEGGRNFKDGFHACVSRTLPGLKEEMTGSTPQDRFREATKRCKS